MVAKSGSLTATHWQNIHAPLPGTPAMWSPTIASAPNSPTGGITGART